MKATELRIGNYLNTKDGKLAIVEKITKDDYIAYSGMITKLPLSPILLTEDWLLKFGWVWNEECKSYEGKDIRMNLKYESVSNSYTMFNYVIKAMICKRIWYVHQLQNLYFSLTGEELKTS